MPPADPTDLARHVLELANHIDRVRRRHIDFRDGVVVREFAGGWLSAEPGAKLAEFPSASGDRVYWLTARAPLSQADVDAAQEAARAVGRPMFIWLAPWAWSPAVEAMLNRAGAEPWPYVEYIALVRPAGDCVPARASDLRVAPIGAAYAAPVLADVRSWYGDTGVEAARRMIDRAERDIELHAAFDGERPVAVAMLTIDGAWAYLGAAGTDPACRGSGAQTALICSRVQHAARLGARWCVSETNTVVGTSLRNLRRCGFQDTILWRVYWWGVAGEGAPGGAR
jgi:GNAT superfamily N-acetyltransferase